MIFPTVHLNGTSKKDLLRSIEEAHSQIREAINSMADVAPNARDYYVQGGGAYKIARIGHCERVQKLLDVKKDLEALARSISFQGRQS